MSERVVSITGALTSVTEASTQISTNVQADPNLRDHINLSLHGVDGSAAVQAAYATGGGGGGGGGVQYGGGPQFALAGQYTSTPTVPAISLEVMNLLCEIHFEISEAAVSVLLSNNRRVLQEVINASGAAMRISPRGSVQGTRTVTVSGPATVTHVAHLLTLQRLSAVAAEGRSG
eukprot:GHVU01088500.1.p1 GENE.GHVU01088500.1~~GHVU01088500.1.p1  ORF type:complete len:175 (+),score=30.28 GHVU01088500.1:143-667(+)